MTIRLCHDVNNDVNNDDRLDMRGAKTLSVLAIGDP